jgi:hypothetical protein
MRYSRVFQRGGAERKRKEKIAYAAGLVKIF